MQEKKLCCVVIVERAKMIAHAIGIEETNAQEQTIDSRPDVLNTQDTSQELSTYKKLLLLEIGSEELLNDALKNPGSWKGRAEQIAELQERLHKLTARRNDSLTIIVDRKKTNELEAQLAQMSSSNAQLEREKQSLRARIKSLESALSQMREDMRVLAERELLNSRIFSILRGFLNLD